MDQNMAGQIKDVWGVFLTVTKNDVFIAAYRANFARAYSGVTE